MKFAKIVAATMWVIGTLMVAVSERIMAKL